MQYELRIVDLGRWHENLGRTRAKIIYCYHILTLWQLRAPCSVAAAAQSPSDSARLLPQPHFSGVSDFQLHHPGLRKQRLGEKLNKAEILFISS